MTEQIIDYSNSVEKYKKALERLSNNKQLPQKNRELAVNWIKQKEESLQEELTKEQREETKHRRDKTLNKYCSLLTNICYWFPDLKNINEQELKQFKEDFYNDKIKSIKGKILKEKRDYIMKIIKSDFFKNYLEHKTIVEKVFNGKTTKQTTPVEYITIEDFRKLIEKTRYDYQKAALYLLFFSGMRIGTLLNMKKKDLELKYNSKTKVSYYLCHIRKEYTKSKEDRTIPIIEKECNEFIEEYIKELREEERLIPVSYTAIRNILRIVCEETKVRTKPNNKKPSIHILRKSTAMYLIDMGYSTDQIKAWLGHKPSSTVIDSYITYSGIKFEPEVTRVQTNELLTLRDTLKETGNNLNTLQQKYDDLKKEMEDKEKDIKEWVAKEIIKQQKLKP